MEKQTEDQRLEERSQNHDQARTQTINASAPSQPKHPQVVASSAHKSYAQMAALHSSKVNKVNSWTKVTSSRKEKANASPKVEPKKRRIIFCREALAPKKSETDLMLALNKALQKAAVSTYTRFSKVGYS